MDSARPEAEAAEDPFGAWLEARGPAPPGRRVLVAFGALLAGWLAGAAVTWLVEAGTRGRTAVGDLLLFDLLIGVFGAAAWVVSVLPLALFGNHDSWFYRPVLAPVVGAVCGVVLLLLEIWIFFGDPPWGMIRAGAGSGGPYLSIVGAVVGAVAWTTYTARMHRRRRTSG